MERHDARDDDRNPLLSRAHRIAFDQVRADHVATAVEAAVRRAEAALAALLERQGERTYATTVEPLDDLLERVDRVYGYAYHLTTVRSTSALREAFASVQPRYKAFRAQVASDPTLFAALSEVARGAEAASLSPLQRRHLDKTLAALRRSGAALEPSERERVTALRVRLAALATRFSEHVLDATEAFHLDLDEAADLDGLPEAVVLRARQAGRAAGLEGWRISLHAPSFLPFMRHSRRRDLRERLWRAYGQRASASPHDNRPLIAEILRLRRELAERLGYRDYAELALEERMIGGVADARGFLAALTERTRPYLRREISALERFARDELGIDELEPWDVRFAFERLREALFDLDEQALRPYFPLPRVQQGMFDLAGDLFGVRFERVDAPERWHDDVECFRVRDEHGTHLGDVYTDWYPRDGKRDGAWMNALIEGGPRPDGTFDPHLGIMCGNLTPGDAGDPALLDVSEVQTLFHEFGHLLHQLLTRVEVRARGVGAVAWDFIELPSQLMENWTHERAALVRFARRSDGSVIPDDVLERLEAARHFMEPWAQMRQLSFAALDIALHVDFDPAGDESATAFAQRTMTPYEIAPRFVPEGFLCAFSHVMSGGYAAGYYAYKWSEVLDADAFTRFREAGLFDRATGRAFVDTILSRGDAADPAELFEAFMGRPPRLEALIERGLGPAPSGG